MICRNCGSNINDGQKFCTVCGSPIEELSQTPVQPVTPSPQTENIFAGGEQLAVNTTQVNANEPTYAPTSVVGTYPVYETKKQSNLWFILTTIILGVIILISSGVIVKKSINLAKSNDASDYLEDVDIYEDDGEVTITNENTYVIDGYKFVIPTGFKKKTEYGIERIGDSNFQLGYFSITSNGTYSYYKDNAKELVSQLKEQYPEAIYINTSEKTYSGQKFLIMAFEMEDLYNDFVLTELPDGSILNFTAGYTNEVYRENGYAKTAKFVKSVNSVSGAASGSVDFSASSMQGLN